MTDALAAYLTEARAIARDAGRVLLEGWRTGARATKKGVIDLVTDFDLRSEALVRARLAAAFPQHAVVAEEGGGAEGEDGYTWFVDPLDGTTNFAHGHFFFCVSIGLVKGREPVLGVVHAPALGVTWSGARGLGAVRAYADGRTEALHVSATETLDDAMLATGFPYDRRTSDENNLREFAHLKLRTQAVRRCGAAAIDLSLVADGTYDGYWEQKLKPWDLCAGAALVREAGGTVSDYDGGEADVRTGRLVASNGRIHGALLAEVDAARHAPR